jgi:hypothetical protein
LDVKRLIVVVMTVAVLAGLHGHSQDLAGSAGAARPMNFVVSQSCPVAYTEPTVAFAIPGAGDLAALDAAGAQQIWLDLSLFDNGFAPGTFAGAGPFGPRASAFEFHWPGIDKNRVHYYRLNALRNGQWIELGRGVFEAVNCWGIEGIRCQPGGTVSVQFGISPAYSSQARPALQQWLDLTVMANHRSPAIHNGFLPGTFVSAGPFPVSATHFTWAGIAPGLRHWYRKNVLYADGRWDQVYGGSFLPLDCRSLPALTLAG